MSASGKRRDAVVRPEAIVVKATVGQVRLGQRSYMSSWMLRLAKRSAGVAAEIEAAHAGDWSSPHIEEHMDQVLSSVLASANFLEAMINELFTDAFDAHGLTKDGYLAPLPAEVAQLMAAWWEESGEGMDKTLAKYQLLLSFAGQPKLDRGVEPFQSAALLLRLRNAIVHYRPTTVYSDEPHALATALAGKFETNQLIAQARARNWPNGILSAGCAEWAHRSVEAIADEVVGRIDITPNYRRMREHAR